MKPRIIKLLMLALLVGATTGKATAQFQRTDIHDEASQVQPLLPGMPAAEFNVLDVQGQAIHFDPENMKNPLVLTFFRGGWCPYCNLHLAELRKAESELDALGFDIWFISIDQPQVLYASLDDPDIAYTIYSDSKLSATRGFGLAFRMPDEMVERYLGWDIDLEAASGESHHVLPAPATFIIGTDGIIQFQFTNPNYKVRLHPDVLLAAARVYTDGDNERLLRQREAQRKE
jgi:peroxiredoxin